MKKSKKMYEKPKLAGVDMLEAGAMVTTCCRSGTCGNNQRKARGKTNGPNTTS